MKASGSGDAEAGARALDRMYSVIGLYHYPVKSCAGTELPSALLTSAGLAHDRTFLVTDERGVYRTQRRQPRLALIRPVINGDGARLVLRAEDRTPFSLDVDLNAPRRRIDLFGAGFAGIDQGDSVAEWISDVLGARSRLVRVPPEHDRRTDGLTPGTSAYADSSAVLLTSMPSVDDLNRRIAAGGAAPVPPDRFRPNIVVDGPAEPYLEDGLRRIEVGDACLGYTKPAIRCVITTVDQGAGIRTGPEPLRTLAGYRRARRGGVGFGVKFAVVRPGKISVGDPINVTAWGVSELPDY